MNAENQSNEIIDKLKKAVMDADYDATALLAKEALDSGMSPGIIMEKGVCDALMDLEHELFGEMKAWMHPRHLMAAESARRALEVLEPSLENGSGSLGTIVLGVPTGDTHDFGTKTVALALTAAGFKVEYLGRDIPATRFVQKAEEIGADIIGISCYQTTGYEQIKKTIDLMSRTNLQDKIKVMVGGSAVTPKYAEKMDLEYAASAAGAVQLARELMRR